MDLLIATSLHANKARQCRNESSNQTTTGLQPDLQRSPARCAAPRPWLMRESIGVLRRFRVESALHLSSRSAANNGGEPCLYFWFILKVEPSRIVSCLPTANYSRNSRPG